MVKFVGIIPAYAGSTSTWARIACSRGDHPRVCGEHHVVKARVRIDQGSSPRMRGAPIGVSLCHFRDGIIPAYAGSTTPPLLPRLPQRDHPRVCGEHSEILDSVVAMLGSSPRMRGARECRCIKRRKCGIIPAYAGSTCSRCSRGAAPWDHPRVCGEHRMTLYASVTSTGSSPRMRGARAAVAVLEDRAGIIPAYAGSTLDDDEVTTLPKDHPRVCGEHVEHRRGCASSLGSSPRMRGARLAVLRDQLRARIIPAYAGSTALAVP